MKETHIVKGLVAFALAVGLVCEASAQNMVPLKAKVVRKAGNARFTTGNNVWQPVKVGDMYGAGTIIQTEQTKGSYVDIVLGDGKGSSVGEEIPERDLMIPITARMASYQP